MARPFGRLRRHALGAERHPPTTYEKGIAMGLMDNAKDMAGKAKDALDQVKDLADEHADKIPGDLGDKAQDLAGKADELTDKIPGQD